MQKIALLLFSVHIVFNCENLFGQKEFQIDTFSLNEKASIRGLSVVNNDIVWVSGNKGFVAVSVNGGKNWSVKKIPNADSSDFRDIEGFDDKTAIIMKTG